MWLARDKDGQLYLYLYDEPKRLEKTGMFKNQSDFLAFNSPTAIRLEEKDDTYKDITWENSPIELISLNKIPKYQILTFPEAQKYINMPGFEENSYIIQNEDDSCYYYVKWEWLKEANRKISCK